MHSVQKYILIRGLMLQKIYILISYYLELSKTQIQKYDYKKSKDYIAQSFPRVNTEQIPVLLQWRMTVLSPDFTGVIPKSGDISVLVTWESLEAITLLSV